MFCNIKDVFQHLPNDKINNILDKLKNKNYKYILIINDTCKTNCNMDINSGMYRPLDITLKPFNINAEKVFSYYDKIYLTLFLIYLLVISYLVYSKGYKLYISMLIILIIIAIFLFPKKCVFQITKNNN